MWQDDLQMQLKDLKWNMCLCIFFLLWAELVFFCCLLISAVISSREHSWCLKSSCNSEEFFHCAAANLWSLSKQPQHTMTLRINNDRINELSQHATKSKCNSLMKHDFCFYLNKWCKLEFLIQKIKTNGSVYTSVSTQLLTYFHSCRCCCGCRLRNHSSILNVRQRKPANCHREVFLFIRTDALVAVTGRWRCTPASVQQGEASACSLSASFACRCWTLSNASLLFAGSSCQLQKNTRMNHVGREFFHCLFYFFIFKFGVNVSVAELKEGALRLLSAPLLLCTGVWSCFLMSSGTTGALALCPSVLTFSMCSKAFIDPLCIHTFTKTPNGQLELH